MDYSVVGSGILVHTTLLDFRQFPDVSFRYARSQFSTPPWHDENIESGNVGRYSALAMDPQGRVHVAYSGPDQQGLRYARRDPVLLNLPEQQQVSTSNFVGSFWQPGPISGD
jgi:hypothetical protein